MIVPLVVLMLAMIACGNDGGNNDSILTGASGVVIFGIIAWVVFRYISKKGRTK